MRDNPLPFLMIGAGVAMLAINATKQRRDEQEYNDTALQSIWERSPQTDNESEDDYSHRLHAEHAEALGMRPFEGEGEPAFRGRVHQAVHAVRRRMRRTQEQVSQATGYAAVQTQRFYDDNPMAAGAIAMAVGAAVAAMAPLTQVERRAFSGVADKASAMGADAIRSAGRSLSSARESSNASAGSNGSTTRAPRQPKPRPEPQGATATPVTPQDVT
jgi:hypothetical protein